MKTKYILLQTLALALVTLAPGCCTYSVLEDTRKTSVDQLKPVAVYRSLNSDRVAVEGNLQNRREYGSGAVRDHGMTFVIIPAEKWPAQRFPKGELAISDQLSRVNLSPANHFTYTNHLDDSYLKVMELHPSVPGIDIRRHYPRRAEYLLVPFSVIGDVILFPFDWPILPFYTGGIGC